MSAAHVMMSFSGLLEKSCLSELTEKYKVFRLGFPLFSASSTFRSPCVTWPHRESEELRVSALSSPSGNARVQMWNLWQCRVAAGYVTGMRDVMERMNCLHRAAKIGENPCCQPFSLICYHTTDLSTVFLQAYHVSTISHIDKSHEAPPLNPVNNYLIG